MADDGFSDYQRGRGKEQLKALNNNSVTKEHQMNTAQSIDDRIVPRDRQGIDVPDHTTTHRAPGDD